ncbi:hypothetical protein FACS189413_14680 [Bacteroidia bacterium]|nr:hypothetical protein FACS189463_0230 [Bacteroidia bacterium]GHU72098.1 hypothetical protein FACS189413_14680 [Bacteroidia bacterium]
MKTKIIIIAIFFVSWSYRIYSQPINIAQHTRWSEVAVNETIEEPVINQYEIEGDTIISLQSYYKLFKNNKFCVAIREDESQQVFAYFPEMEQELLLYDFNWDAEFASDSIRLFNNKLYAVKDSEHGKIIQGIGSLNGFFTHLPASIEQSVELLCYWRNEQLLYLNPNYTNCEGGKTYKSCFGKEYTKYTLIVDTRNDGLGSESFIINDQLELVDYSNHIRAYFTEDLSSGKLVFKKEGSETYEQQMMDLNVWIGDIIPLGNYFQGTCYEGYHYDSVDDYGYAIVDSIYFKDNRKHVRMDVMPLRSPGDKFLFVEGRGPNTGLHYYIGYEHCTYLLCYETESEFYLNPEFNDCSYIVSIPTTNLSEPVEITQTDQVLQVRFAKPFSGILSLYDNSGRMYSNASFKDQVETALAIKDLNRGIYLLKCQDVNGKLLQTVKIIIH